MGQRVAHVLVHHVVLGVQEAVLLGQHVHGEAVGGHQLVLLGCTGPKRKNRSVILHVVDLSTETNRWLLPASGMKMHLVHGSL